MNLYQQYADTMRKIADIGYSAAILQWDNEVYLPKEGSQYRSRQLATLMGMAHELFTNKKFGKLLDDLVKEKLKGKGLVDCYRFLVPGPQFLLEPVLGCLLGVIRKKLVKHGPSLVRGRESGDHLQAGSL